MKITNITPITLRSPHGRPIQDATIPPPPPGDAGRGGRILRASGAGPDHPVHPFLPETAYLKALLLQID